MARAQPRNPLDPIFDIPKTFDIGPSLVEGLGEGNVWEATFDFPDLLDVIYVSGWWPLESQGGEILQVRSVLVDGGTSGVSWEIRDGIGLVYSATTADTNEAPNVLRDDLSASPLFIFENIRVIFTDTLDEDADGLTVVVKYRSGIPI